jgi:hypothetical protein
LVSAKDPQQQSDLLDELLPSLHSDAFDWRGADVAAVAETKFALLKVWHRLLAVVDQAAFHQRPKMYETMFRIMTRYEFDLVHFLRWDRGSFSDKISTPTDLAILQTYQKCLFKTAYYVLDKLGSDDCTVVQKKFAIQVLLVLYFRAPLCAGSLIEVFSQHAAAMNSEPSEWKLHFFEKLDRYQKELHSRLSVTDELGAQFFHWNPSFFQWILISDSVAENALSENIMRLQFGKGFEEIMSLFMSLFVGLVSKNSFGPIQWHLVPGFAPLIKTLFESLVVSFLSRYSLS